MRPLDPASLALSYPTSILRVWGANRASRERVREAILGTCDAIELDDHALAIVPKPADPAIFDAGLQWSRKALAAVEAAVDGPRVLLSPAEILMRGGEVLGVHDDVAQDVTERPPNLRPNEAYLTTWAAQTLEMSWDLQSGGGYRGPSGRHVPLVRAAGRSISTAPWRNAALLGRRIPWTPRPEIGGLLDEHLEDSVVRVTGPPGCGKSRLVWETLQHRASIFLWLHAQPERRQGPSLAQQIAEQLLEPREDRAFDPLHPRLEPHRRRDPGFESPPARPLDAVLAMLAASEPASGPLWLVCDDFEQVQEEDLELLLELGNAHLPDRALRLVLIGRGGVARSGFEGTFSLRVPRFEGEELATLSETLFSGLSLPDSLKSQLLAATRGHPFALEEGLLSLVRKKVMRTLYGNFFFAGTEPAAYRPSPRLISHLQSETGRLGHVNRMTLLALADTPVPPAVLSAAAGRVENERSDAWATAALDAGLLRRVPSPWGVGVEFACPAYARALALSAPPETAGDLRARLGRALQSVSRDGEQHWCAYRLLAGTRDAADPLLKTARSSFARTLDPAVLFAALEAELASHRQAGGDEGAELLLIWRLLPAARRLGKLQHCIPELERALELTREDPEKQLALASLIASAHQEGGHYRQAETTLLSALETTSTADQTARRARLALQLGGIYERTGRLSEASRLLEDLYPPLERQQLRELAASCHFTLGEIALRRNRLEEAITHHRAAYETRVELGDDRSVAASLTALGRVAHTAGNYPQALEYFDEALNRVADKTSEDCARVLLGTANVLRRLGDYQHAATLNRRALAIHEQREEAAAEAAARLALAETLLDLEQFEKALVEARQVHFKMDLLSMPSELADAEQLIGRIELRHRKHDLARSHLDRALAAHLGQGNSRGAALDRSLLIDLGIATEDGSALREHTAGLKELLAGLQHSSIVESLNYRMFLGLSWLRLHDARVDDPRPYLEHAYREVLRKAFPLDPERRHQFLFEVPDNRAILDLATHEGLDAPD
ncbi:MAG: tetratricopeptide repeat protein [Acidobacteriota bacterium]|nr:tetratricopeptide repeat protein [Acidobacteriota bacterium]MDH3524018.1 tetratricopeptide repeat protein [Acidobacteriota bacterium]